MINARAVGYLGRRLVVAVLICCGVGCNTSPGRVASGGAAGAAAAGGQGEGGMGGTPFSLPDEVDASQPMARDSSACPGPTCPGSGASAAICGNGAFEQGELCDDGNAMPGDGCSGICRIEPNFRCVVPGEPCLSTIVCGDGKLAGKEGCDDGNLDSKDGCSMSCQVEVGFGCSTPGQPCTAVTVVRCGDGIVNIGETCDDGGDGARDGCSETCQIEPGFHCPSPGESCERDEFCGDGRLSDKEYCDDGNVVPGDGCTGTCRLEPFFVCPVPGTLCQTTIVCGDLKVTGDEACDDGGMTGGDGCSIDCKTTEPGYTCPTSMGVGGTCTAVVKDVCGDGRLSIGEYCDDGNTDPTDGCTQACRVTPGYTCPVVGKSCMLVEWCGDGKLSVSRGEECDDGDGDGGDGCTATCLKEADFSCPEPGSACVSNVVCGDGVISGAETCDDRDAVSGDGCSAICKTEPGWRCSSGANCRAERCGDLIVAGTERCDDGDVANGDGCDSACQIESPGATERNAWICPPSGGKCMRSLCGDGITEGNEQCDDKNNDSGDGCSPFCRREPFCPPSGGPCTTACGDGLLLPVDIANGQMCDDGDTISGDGCSSSCQVEDGFLCETVNVEPNPLVLPIVYRDFMAYNKVGGHPDFWAYGGGDPGDVGIPENTLGPNGKPVHTGVAHRQTTNNDPGVTQDYYSFWYRDDNNPFARPIVETLTFDQIAAGTYRYDSNRFFPIDGRGWGDSNFGSGANHNFLFSSEIRYWFEYRGNETLTFTGDDDLWVFVNKRLAVDLGGLHGASPGSIVLHATDGTGSSCDFVTNPPTTSGPCTAPRTIDLGLKLGSVYEIAVFHAERSPTESNFRLTLSGFGAKRSKCNSVCGDAIVTADEVCDLGTERNTGDYGTCNRDCTLSERCGDKVVQATEGELCDDGANLATYSGSKKDCGPACKWAPFCGDGRVDGGNGEACDEGANNGRGYGYCTATCQPGPRCGDKIVSDAETCDDGNANGTSQSLCTDTCVLKCGNGVLDGGEQCDDGVQKNVGGYAKCNPNCTLGPRCGDGIRNSTEACDDGRNDGSYGTCAPMCVLGARCGDGVVQDTASEKCDLGEKNGNGYGREKCTLQCRPAPFCGDRSIDISNGEKCDDGVNSGMPGSCATDCKGWVDLPSCGNGIKDKGEQCDDGGSANGTSESSCDVRCRMKCGNGFVDAGEQCDNGLNDGSYGTCTGECLRADYCGDGKRSGPEACDMGTANTLNPYGAARCTLQCTVAPFCGDNLIQTAFGEACDGQPGCDSASCRYPVFE